MSTDIYFEDSSNNDEWDKKKKLMCKCGHTLLMHGSTMNFNDYTQQTYLRVSQCVHYGCNCRGFELE